MMCRFSWNPLGLVAAMALLACTSHKAESLPTPPAVASADAGVCQPLTCASSERKCGRVQDGCGGVLNCGVCSRCGPEEMECCGACIPKSEQVCPVNVHCPTSHPAM
ncbi:hypothetical protein SAMN05443639_116111 [Stigmatella erecta]|uniref:Uncharacterized protein n=1 Tax=Stigmatella erecta TaxID=83460 RepID=A0A1I0L0M4_9BACT|nr:hypothetical protein SAMN05443639_116111 [Stigmatella erecta]